MSLDTYSNLKIEIGEYLDRDDLTSFIDGFIDLAEEAIANELRVRSMIKRAQAPCSTSSRYLALPTDYLDMRMLRLLTTPLTIVDYVNNYEMARNVKSSSDIPSMYTIHEEIEFEVQPASAYTAEMIYYSKPVAISAAQETSPVLTSHPSLYLYGSLVAAEPFLSNDERLPVWKDLFTQRMAAANASDRRGRTGGPLFSRVAGAHP